MLKIVYYNLELSIVFKMIVRYKYHTSAYTL